MIIKVHPSIHPSIHLSKPALSKTPQFTHVVFSFHNWYPVNRCDQAGAVLGGAAAGREGGGLDVSRLLK